MRTLIAIPCMDQVPVQFCNSLANLRTAGECLSSFKVSSLIYTARNELAMSAIRADAEYVLWLDSDMVFPPDLMERMLAHMDKYDFVSGLYFRRVSPFTPVAFSKLEINGDKTEFENLTEYPDEPCEIAGCGFGAVMMKTKILTDVFAEFGTAFAPLGNNGEDTAFCWRARQLGYKLMLDPALKLGHVGHTIITEGFYKAVKGGAS